MRAHFFWPDCGLDYRAVRFHRIARSVFWITATAEEFHEHVVALWQPDLIMEFQGINPTELEDVFRLPDGRYYIGQLQREDPPIVGRRTYPYSGMWNGRRPWIPIGPPKLDHPLGEPEGLEIASLVELGQLRIDIHNHFHLVPDAPVV